ncbi:MAG: hypothetical protein U9Q70_06420 [Chloroflexota bacterium]|nr:hypothetical protein [Chloroflexota bacterium]
MINRQNYVYVQEYLQYKEEVYLLKSSTIKRYKTSLKHSLQWAGDVSFFKGYEVRPTLPAYLRDDTDLSSNGIKKVLETTQGLLRWGVQKHPRHFKPKMILSWIDTLRVRHLPQELKRRNPYTLEEVEKIIALPNRRITFTDFRDQAGVAMLFASAMRIDAFVSMPIQAVDLTTNPPEISQWPTLGVRTKFSKAQTTFLTPIPSLIAIIKAWDSLVRAQLPKTALWYAPLTSDGTALRGDEEASHSLTQRMRAGLRRLCALVNIPYRRPHLLRHGHAIYVRQHSHHPSCREAIRFNLMHSPADVTDIYLAPTSETVRSAYLQLSETPAKSFSMESLKAELDEIKRLLTIRR